VDLQVGTGETVLVEGPNGAGKTSLLRVCAGLVPLASGQMSILGLDPVRRRAQVRRRVGLLSHASHLYDDLTVRENVRFAVRSSGADPSGIGDACDRLGLTGRLLKTSASKLSAGQRRRVALAVLTARWPELWLLDEPHAGLDVSARATLDALITEASSSGVTVVIASHEAEVVGPLVTRVVTITGGRVTNEREGDAMPAMAPTSSSSSSSPTPTPTSPPAPPAVAPDAGPPRQGEVAHVA
jgi:heme ABC exporter ATP-binding subunit CcmA